MQLLTFFSLLFQLPLREDDDGDDCDDDDDDSSEDFVKVEKQAKEQAGERDGGGGKEKELYTGRGGIKKKTKRKFGVSYNCSISPSEGWRETIFIT